MSLWRRRYKNGAILLIFSLLIMLVSAVFLSAASIEAMLQKTLRDTSDIYLQRVVAGRMAPMKEERIEKIMEIEGIEAIYPRVWGYYYYAPAGVNFSVVGVDPDFPAFSKAITQILQAQELPPKSMLIGQGVQKVLKAHWYKERFNFIKPDGSMEEVKIAGVFHTDTLFNYDTILLPLALARTVFDLREDEMTDFAITLQNPKEMRTIAQKLRFLFPDCRVITKEDLRTSYQNLFDYKSGVFLALMLAAFFAFFVLVFEKASSVTRSEVREIAILKALGWRVSDILIVKSLESFLILFFALFIGILGAYVWVYIFQAPLLRDLFSGFSTLKPPFVLEPLFEPSLFITLFLLVAPLYIAATIIPNWRAAVVDVEEALR